MKRTFLALLLCLLMFPTLASAQFQRVTVGSILPATASGSLDVAEEAATLDLLGFPGVAVQATGTWVGTLTFEVSVDGTNYQALSLAPSNSTTTATTATANGVWSGSTVGYRYFRVRMSAYTSGTAVVTVRATLGGGSGSGGGGGGSNAAASATGSAVPSSASYSGVNIGGNLVGATGIATGATHKAQVVAIVDSSGNQISTFGGSGGTSVNEDVASADAHPGTPAYTVRNNTLTGATGTDGDYQPMKSTAAGAVYSQLTFGDTVASTGNGASGAQTMRVTLASDSTGVLANVATIGTSVTPGTAAANLGKAIDAAMGASDTGVAALVVRDDALTTLTPVDGDYVPLRTDSVGRLWVNCGTGCAGGTQFAEDVAHTTADVGTVLLTKRTDSAASSAGTDGDYATFNSDANGRIWANIFGVTQAASTYLTVRLTDGTNFLNVGNDYTHDAALTIASTAGPAAIRRAVTSLPTAVSADDAVLAVASTQGQQLVAPTAIAFGGADNHYTTSAASTNSTSVKGSAGTIYDISVVNTTATLYYLRLYNTATAPTCSSATGFIESIPVPASASGAGIVRTFPVGRAYATGIGFCLTGGGSSTDNTNAATGVYISIGYK